MYVNSFGRIQTVYHNEPNYVTTYIMAHNHTKTEVNLELWCLRVMHA